MTFDIQKGVDLNLLVQGGQLYCAFPFSKGSLGKAQIEREMP